MSSSFQNLLRLLNFTIGLKNEKLTSRPGRRRKFRKRGCEGVPRGLERPEEEAGDMLEEQEVRRRHVNTFGLARGRDAAARSECSSLQCHCSRDYHRQRSPDLTWK